MGNDVATSSKLTVALGASRFMILVGCSLLVFTKPAFLPEIDYSSEARSPIGLVKQGPI